MWQFKKALYGTRRAALLFQEYVTQAMVKIGFTELGTTSWLPVKHNRWTCLMKHWNNSFVPEKMPRIGPLEVAGTSEGQFTREQ